MTLNDAHIFCTPDQIKEEFSKVMRLVERAYRDLGITQYSYRLSLRDPANKEKYVDNDAMWELGEQVLRDAMDSLGLKYKEARGEAAFYGPKLDIQLADVMGHEETYSTIQVDFHLPSQFGLEYTGADGNQHRPVMIHRGVISTMERMTSYLIELYAGAFPFWLAPVQVGLVPISERHIEYAKKVKAELAGSGPARGTGRAQREDEREDPRPGQPEDSLHPGLRRQGAGGERGERAHARQGRPGVDAAGRFHRQSEGAGGVEVDGAVARKPRHEAVVRGACEQQIPAGSDRKKSNRRLFTPLSMTTYFERGKAAGQ